MGLIISQERLAGWRDALAEAGVVPEPGWLAEGDFSLEAGHRQGLVWLQQGDVTAVFASNDLMALGVLRAAAQMGVPVPGQLSVVGIDGIDIGRYTHPALTTVGASLRAVGQEAGEMLLHRIQHPEGPVQKRVRALGLMVRESTGPVPGAGT
jgi:LacI family transcriptional regulator